MICNYCYENKNLINYIEECGEKARIHDTCTECGTVNDHNDMYRLSKIKLSKKLQNIILELYENDIDLGMYRFAEKNLCDDGEDPNTYAQLQSLEEICYDLFEDEKLADIISENIIKDGSYEDFFYDKYSPMWKEKCWWNDDNFGLSKWQAYCENVKHRARYFDHKEFSVTEFLKQSKNLFKLLEYSEKLIIYRARKINSLNEEIAIKSNPSCELGKVPIKFAQNNRFSPVGISYGYFALDKNTAIKEIRAIKDDKVAIGKFKITDELKLIDLRMQNMNNKVNIFSDNLDQSLYCQQQFIKEFLKDISKPIKESDQLLEYIPTQIMAEYIWHLGYDGFLFDSSQNHDGVNIVIFEAKYNFIDYEIKTI